MTMFGEVRRDEVTEDRQSYGRVLYRRRPTSGTGDRTGSFTEKKPLSRHENMQLACGAWPFKPHADEEMKQLAFSFIDGLRGNCPANPLLINMALDKLEMRGRKRS